MAANPALTQQASRRHDDPVVTGLVTRARNGDRQAWDELMDRYAPLVWSIGVLDIGRDPETRKRRRRKVSAPTKTECREKLDELREEYRKAGTVGRRDITVRWVVDDFLAHPPEEWKSGNTLAVYTDAGKRICDGARGVQGIGGTQLARLTVGDVDRVLAGLARAGYAAKTIRQTLSVLRRSLRRAQRNGLTSRNVAELADLPAGAKTRKSRAMTSEQVAALLALDLTPWWRAYITTAVMTGLRPGELLGLRCRMSTPGRG